MNRVFGKKKEGGPAPPTLTQASLGVDDRMVALDVKIQSLEKELKGYKDKLKTTRNDNGKKLIQRKAMDVLKRKRMYEQQREQLAGQQFNIDQTSFNIESAKASVTTVAAMKAANMQLKQTIRKEMDVDAVEDMADDMAELMEDFNEINEALSRNYSTPADVDEEDLEAELGMLDDELEEEYESPTYLQGSKLPANPTGPIGSKPAAQQMSRLY